ncbi:uncharacterized protein V1513DRAFT_39777 [Lipomyces chichibuensis]|uniref:uncharacterized protein n=1 Tax=Lipomyces chichibuensis TaxID=1546026 RepID=UPI0033430D26
MELKNGVNVLLSVSALHIPCVLIGYVFFPHSPNNTKPIFWLSLSLPFPSGTPFMRGFTFSLITSILHVLLVILIFVLERRDLWSGNALQYQLSMTNDKLTICAIIDIGCNRLSPCMFPNAGARKSIPKLPKFLYLNRG